MTEYLIIYYLMLDFGNHRDLTKWSEEWHYLYGKRMLRAYPLPKEQYNLYESNKPFKFLEMQ